MKSLIITLVLVLMTTSQAMAGEPTDVNICHWQEYNGIWKLIVVSDHAVEKHLTIHDDSFPGEATNFTGIQLDESCVEVVDLPSCGDCLNSHANTPGCSNTECQNLVGAADAFCITYGWDGSCASKAATMCEDIICQR